MVLPVLTRTHTPVVRGSHWGPHGKILGELAALDTLLRARLTSEAMDDQKAEAKDRLLKIDEAAAKLGTTKDYLYRHAEKFPFTVRIGRALRFSEDGIERYIREAPLDKRFR